jgi:hypothetical protein
MRDAASASLVGMVDRFPMMLSFEAASVGRPTALGPLRRVHVSFRSGRLTSSNVATSVLSNQDSNVARRFYRMRDRCAIPRTLFQCVCTRHRNRIGRLSPFSEYAPSASRFKPARSLQSKVPGLGCSTSLERQAAGSVWDAYWSPDEAHLCRWRRRGCEPVQKRSVSGARRRLLIGVKWT